MKKLLLAAFWILCSSAPGAGATPLLSLISQGNAVQPGGRLYVDVVLTGLSESDVVGAFSVDLAFSDALRLAPIASGGSRFGASLGNINLGEALGDATIGAGQASLDEFSLLDTAALHGLQAGEIKLATLLFFLPRDAATPASRMLSIGATGLMLADGDGNLLSSAIAPPIAVVVSEPHELALFLLSLALLACLCGKRRLPLAVAGLAVSCAAWSQTVIQPLPAGPLNLQITSESTVAQTDYITAGTLPAYSASLVPMAVNESATLSFAQFDIVSTQSVTITFSSDDGSNFDRTFEFTPGTYFIGMQYTSPFFGSDYGELWIQKASGGVFGSRLLNVRKDADTYVHAFFRSGPDNRSGILQRRLVDKSFSTTRQISIPGGSLRLSNEDGLWPYPLLCDGPASCAPMRRSVTVTGDGTLTLYSANGANAVTGSVFPSRYDRLDATSSGYTLNITHVRIPFIPPGPPTIAPLPDQAPMLTQDAPRTLTLREISDGTPNETQSVTITASSSDPAIIAAPQIAYRTGDTTALLSYRPGGTAGRAVITVTVRDDGGTPGYPADDSTSTMAFGVQVLDARPCEGRACFAYVTERDSDVIDVIDVETGLVTGKFPGGDSIAVSPDGQRLYSLLRSSVTVVDTSTRRVIATIPVPEGFGTLSLSPSGEELMVSIPAQVLGTTDRILVFDTRTNAAVASIDLGDRQGADAMAFSPDGTRLYVTGEHGRLAVVDILQRTVLTTSAIPSGPHRIAIANDGERLFVTSVDHGTLSIYNRNLDVVHQTAVGNRPRGVALTPDGRQAFVTVFNDAFSGDLAVVDTGTGSVLGRVGLGGLNGPNELAFTPDGTRLFVSFETDRVVAMVAPVVRRLAARTPIGTPTLGIAIGAAPLPLRLLGDVNRDGAIDRHDIDLLRADLGKTPAEARCGIACDLDADGTITVLDARRLATLCTSRLCRPSPITLTKGREAQGPVSQP